MRTLRDEIKILEAYGTSEGAKKAWDTRGRGRKAEEPQTGIRRFPPLTFDQKESFARLASEVYSEIGHDVGIESLSDAEARSIMMDRLPDRIPDSAARERYRNASRKEKLQIVDAALFGRSIPDKIGR